MQSASPSHLSLAQARAYPYFPLDQNKNLQQVGLSAADIQAIESGNASRLLPQLKPGPDLDRGWQSA
jgi:hypothetical protein